jgi:predicted AlkP superfamily phosphohydrolase/phosphomutase
MAVNVNDFLASAGLLKYDDQLAISWSETLAYAAGSGQLWLNVRGRESQGVVRTGREFRKVSEMLAHELLSHWQDPLTDEPIVEKVLTKEQAYSGEYMFKAPDLTIVYRPGYVPSANARALRLDGMSVLRPALLDAVQPYVHRPYARLLMSGSVFQQGFSGEASLLDLFPTILHLLGLELPVRLDGNVIEDVFSEEYQEYFPVKYLLSEDEPLSREDESLILSRLRELGYLS